MNSRAIVATLLETGDMDAPDPKAYALSTREYQLSQLPPEVRDVLEYAPAHFVDAYFDKADATWELEPGDSVWPEYDSADDVEGTGWMALTYYTEYSVEHGVLLQNICYSDPHGNHDFLEAAEVGSDVWRRMLEPYSYYRWQEANAAYSAWVAKNGHDPLRFFNIARVKVEGPLYKIGFVQRGTQAQFWMARQITGDGNSPPATDDVAALPKEVQDYINVDANGINQDVDWAGMLALTTGGEPDRPVIKHRPGGGIDYIEFQFKSSDSKSQDVDYAKKLKALARKAAASERRLAKKAKISHKKQPHYVV